MSFLSKILTLIAAGALLAAASAASVFANPNYTNPVHPALNHYSPSISIEQGILNNLTSHIQPNKRIYGGSDTASFYYRVGVRQFDKGNLDKAERAFNAVLRANGLNKQAHYYLAKINIAQGDKETAVKHAKSLRAYYK